MSEEEARSRFTQAIKREGIAAMSEDGIDGWEAHKRQDGALVLVTELGNWIATVEGRPALTTCPCCDKPFATARAAKRVCDALYPMATA